MVYFIKDYGSGHIKIGYTSGGMYGATQRLNGLQTASSTKLEILAVMRGSRETEKSLHEKFKDEHTRGEWFIPSARLMEYILPLLENQHDDAEICCDEYEDFEPCDRITLKVPNDVIAEIKRIAKIENRSISNMTTVILMEALQKLNFITRKMYEVQRCKQD